MFDEKKSLMVHVEVGLAMVILAIVAVKEQNMGADINI